jgi:hypothetical protein
MAADSTGENTGFASAWGQLQAALASAVPSGADATALAIEPVGAAIALLELADIDHELALAEADSLLLQSTLLEMIAAMSPEDQEAVPRKIKDMLSLIDVLTKETALALVPELDSAKARERSELSNTSMRQEDTSAAAPSPETLAQALAPAAKKRARQEAAQQLDELVAHVTHWRSSARCVCVFARARECV